MFKVNEYFDGKVKSIAFTSPEGPATVGVMAVGEYEFGTASVEIMSVISGAMEVKLPGAEGWKTIKADQPGWTHQYMQNCRTMVRKAVVTCATLIGVVWPIVTSVLVGYVLCLALRLAAARAAL